MTAQFNPADFAIAAPATDLAKEIAARAAGKEGGGIKEIMEGRSDKFQINPFLLKIKPGFNSRDFTSPEVLAHVDETAQSIAKHGVKKALTIHREGNQFYVTDGECRLRAVHRAINVYGAKIVTVPVELEARGSNDIDRMLTQRLNNTGLRFSVMEEAAWIKKLVGLGMPLAEIAAEVGKGKDYVEDLLDLNSVPESVKAMVRDGLISATEVGKLRRQYRDDNAGLLAAIEGAKTAAAAQGKARITARHIAPRKPTLKVSAAEIFGRAQIEEDAENFEAGQCDDDVQVVISMCRTDYRRLVELGLAPALANAESAPAE